MDAAQHAAHVAQIREWLDAHTGHEFSVSVRTGANVVAVADGPFLGLEEHPVSRGVFRALFADARRVSLKPDEQKYVSFGFELRSVVAERDRLLLDSGSQQIEIVDLTANVMPTADDVTWPSSQPPAPPPPPAPPVAGPVLELTVKAPIYGNAMGSGFFGPVSVRIEQGWMTVAGMRSDHKGGMIVGGTALWVIGIIGLVFGLIVAVNAGSDSDMGFAFCLMGFGLLFLLVGLALYLVGRARFTQAGRNATLQFRLADAVGTKAHYDTNLGCLLMIVATPIIGLVIMFAMGKRIVRMTMPNDRLPGSARQMLVLKAASNAEGARLDAALRG